MRASAVRGNIVNIRRCGLVEPGATGITHSTQISPSRASPKSLAVEEVKQLGIKVTRSSPAHSAPTGRRRSMWSRQLRSGDYDENVRGTRKTMIKRVRQPPAGDPRKVAEAVLIGDHVDEPPLRLLLGRDVLKAVRDKLAAFSSSIDEWESVTKDVNFPKD